MKHNPEIAGQLVGSAGSFDLLGDIPAELRFSAHVAAGTRFLTRSGKLPVERLQSSMIVIDANGSHRSVVWVKRITNSKIQDPQFDNGAEVYARVTPQTRFADIRRSRIRTTDTPPLEFWLVLSTATKPIKNAQRSTGYGSSPMRPNVHTGLGEFAKEAEVTNIFAEFDTSLAMPRHV